MPSLDFIEKKLTRIENELSEIRINYSNKKKYIIYVIFIFILFFIIYKILSYTNMKKNYYDDIYNDNDNDYDDDNDNNSNFKKYIIITIIILIFLFIIINKYLYKYDIKKIINNFKKVI